MEKYSVLMSVYIKEKPEYLQESMESMMNQTVLPDEIVLVEDGEITTELNAVIAKFQERYPGVLKLVFLKENKGLGAALNIGLSACRNELVARMDTDDIAFPDRCEKQLAVFEKNERMAVVGAQIYEFIGSKSNIVSARIVPTSAEDILAFAHRRSPFNHPTVMYKKSVVAAVGGYLECGRKEDLALFLKIVFGGFEVANLSEPLLYYRTSADQLTRRKSWVNCSENISIMYQFFKEKKIGLTDISYVVAGQLALFILPNALALRLSNKYLREKVIEEQR